MSTIANRLDIHVLSVIHVFRYPYLHVYDYLSFMSTIINRFDIHVLSLVIHIHVLSLVYPYPCPVLSYPYPCPVLSYPYPCILEVQPFSFPQSITEGERVLVACTTKSGDKSGGQLSFKWLKDGKELSTRTQVKTFGDFSTIVIDPVSEEDSGNYTCAVTNGGLHDSYTAQLTVMVPPQWLSAPNDVSSFSGEFLIINCKASGNPRGIDGLVAVSESEMLRLPSNGSLIIEQVSKSDE
ncbi:Down syndrome cell adhesion molecule like protein [Argiope bruennichi]|uniref:Down syndrome cell adhesion molecule like protein n=1 Tax=Argiope bruennichi TaxID=94029 RepID=A0A8T0FQI0_ARGBR|nr:Down syndrome cell adhesion molecule like protein [Argiope bruennichi]